MADIFQGAPLPATVTTTQDVTSAPEFYTNYLQDIANLGQAGVQQGGVAGFSPLQQQALSLAPEVAFAGAGSAATGQQFLGASGATPATDLVQQYMNPYQQNVVNEMARLQNRAIQESVIPSIKAGAAGSGQFGSQRAAQVTGQTLRDLQADLLGRQYNALAEGYKGALGAAQTDLSRQMQAGQALGQLGQTQQGMGAAGLKTLFDLGAQEQALGQKVLDQPMEQAQKYGKLLQGYQVPTTVTKQTVGSSGYATSPLAQLTGLLSVLGSLNKNSNASGNSSDNSSSSAWSTIFNLLTKADGGEVSMPPQAAAPQIPNAAAYTDGQGNFYDVNGYLVE